MTGHNLDFQSEPTPKAVAADPDHPLANQTLLIYNTYSGEDQFASFAYTAAPPGEKAAQDWIRLTYPDQTDAMPIQFIPVEGQKDTYIMYSEWPKYQAWVGYDLATDKEPYLRANFKDQSDALMVSGDVVVIEYTIAIDY